MPLSWHSTAAACATLLWLLADAPNVEAQTTVGGVLGDVLGDIFGDASSPPVFPTPQGNGAGNWSDAYRKATALVANMTLEEKNNITYGHASTTNGCSGNSGSVPRLGFPGLCLQDAGNGVRATDGVNSYASGISVGASWNKSLAYGRAQHMGAEFKTKGANVALGPVVGPLGRVAEGGRNWEGFSNDPYLAGILGAQTVRGLQESVIASVKHFIGNEQETNRNPIALTPSLSSNIDDRTMHELYLWPFQDLIYAGAGCVMCSYQRTNNTYSCQNSKLLNGLLKTELNFQGFVVSDWGAQHAGLESASAGLDMAMPSSSFWKDGSLAAAVRNDRLNETRLTDMATRIVATWYQLAMDSPEYPAAGIGMPVSLTAPHKIVDAKDKDARPTILQGAIEGHVLVKNVNGALPLVRPKLLSLFGYDAVVGTTYNPSGSPIDLWPLGLQWVQFTPAQGVEFATGVTIVNPPGIAAAGTLFTGGGSGSNVAAYISAPYDAIQQQAYEDDTSILFDFSSQTPQVEGASDACLVFVNELASEAFDRPGLADPGSDALIKNVAAQCSNTVVVIHNAGIRLVDAWIDHPNITAVIYAHLPGQDSGRAVVRILYGQVSPSGRLPYTVAKAADDYGNMRSPCPPTNIISPQCDFSEGVNIDYRGFIARNITPRYEFGYGLTYTTFAYSDLQIKVGDSPALSEHATADDNNNNTAGAGGPSILFESVGTITASVRNSGNVAAAEVAQLYIGIPGGPAKQLRGFDKLLIPPNGTARATFELRRRDLGAWDVGSQEWLVPRGEYRVHVGASVLDVRLTGSFTL